MYDIEEKESKQWKKIVTKAVYWVKTRTVKNALLATQDPKVSVTYNSRRDRFTARYMIPHLHGDTNQNSSRKSPPLKYKCRYTSELFLHASGRSAPNILLDTMHHVAAVLEILISTTIFR